MTLLNGLLLIASFILVFVSFQQNNSSAGFASKYSLSYDHMSEAIKIKKYLTKYFISSFSGETPKSIGSSGKEQKISAAAIRKSLLSAYYSRNLAISQEDGSYLPYRPHDPQANNGSPLFIHPESVLFHRAPKMICFHEGKLAT